MGGSKIFCNETNKDVTVTIYIRKGDDHKQNYGTVLVSLKPGESKGVDYGCQRNAFLNGLKISFSHEGMTLAHEQMVLNKHSMFDKLLNNNTTIILDKVSPMEVSAYN